MNHSSSGVQTFIAVEDGFKVWSTRFGGGANRERATLLVLHGGPGIGHEYLANLAALASPEQPVVFYDQLGCGRSDRPNEPGRWRVERFVREIDFVRDALSLDAVVLLGQSWGGMLAIEYLLTEPKGIHGAILSNSLASSPMWSTELNRLKQDLPPEQLAAIEAGPSASPTARQAYQNSVMAFYKRHVLRVDPFPKAIVDALAAPNPAYEIMWGSNEFSVTGNLQNWDRIKDLHRIKIPVQLISGQFDESTPRQNRAMLEELPNANWSLMPGCSHLSHLEKPADYLAIVRGFLDELEASSTNAD